MEKKTDTYLEPSQTQKFCEKAATNITRIEPQTTQSQTRVFIR